MLRFELETITMAKEYKDKLTLDGRVKKVPGVTPEKVKAVKELQERHLSGDKIATAILHEVLTTSDAMFNYAHLATLNFLPLYDEEPRTWTQVADTRTVPDFRPATLWTLQRSWTDGNGDSNVLGAHGEAPTIPETVPYPYAYITGVTEQSAGVTKKGFKTDWTLEARINDGMAVLDELPRMMTEAALDTEESEVWTPLSTAGVALAGGAIPSSPTAVPANAPLSRDALIRATIELGERQIAGRYIQIRGGLNLLVPKGQGIFANFVLNQTLLGIETNGTPNFVYQVNGGYNPLSNISVVETEWLTGTQWKLLPKPGGTRRPVVQRLILRGYASPQLFVENAQGSYVGGSAVSPFEGSFDTDSVTLKLRMFGGGVVWDGGQAIVTSTGAGS